MIFLSMIEIRGYGTIWGANSCRPVFDTTSQSPSARQWVT
jgi:hypothetical protein